MAVFYADTSALVRLVRDEAESEALRAFLADADLISSELVLTEIPGRCAVLSHRTLPYPSPCCSGAPPS